MTLSLRLSFVVALISIFVSQHVQALLKIPLTLVERYGESRVDEPVTSGVPLPEGAYQSVEKLRLVDFNGNEIPCQITPLVRWYRDGSLRWVLLDFQATLPAFSTRPFYLRDDGPTKAIENPIMVTEEGNRIIVVTGSLKFAVRKEGFNLVDEAWLDESGAGDFSAANRIVKPEGFSGPVLWSNAPDLPVYRTYMASADPKTVVTVEEAGPMRVVIKAVGRHMAEKPADGNDKLLDFVIRITAYRGQSMLRVNYAAECKQGKAISNFTPVTRWNVVVPGDLGAPEELTYRFGTSGADVAGGFGNQDRAWLVCESADKWEVGGAAYHYSTSGVREGAAMSIEPPNLGYVDLSGPKHGVMIGVRWFWQNNPKGLFVQRDGSVQAALWPSFVRRTSTITGATNDRQANFFPGMSKTHELMLYFHSAGKVKNVTGVHAMLQDPLFAAAEPSWYCEKTLAFGRIASNNPDLYPEELRWQVKNYDFFFEHNQREMARYRRFNRGLDAFGIFNFGDHINHINANRRDNVGERPDPSDIHWDNNYYGFPHSMIIQFARTGNRDFLEYAEQCSTHLQDMDIMCWHPDPNYVGAPRYSAGLDHVRIYGNGDPVYTSDTYNHYKNQSLFERYCLKGDRRALEVGLASAGFARTHMRHAIGQGRSVGHGIIMLLCAFETTCDTSYLDAARNIVEHTRNFRRTKSGAWQDGIALEGHRYWYEVTGDKKAIETVIGGVDAAEAKRDRAGSILQAYAFAADQTGDEKYRKAMLSAFRGLTTGKHVSMIDFGNNFRNTGYLFWYLAETTPKKAAIPPLKGYAE